MRRKHYRPIGYCPHCGYRISPGRCAECGAVVERPWRVHPRIGRTHGGRLAALFGVGIVSGWLMWWASPFVIGQAEPWDGTGRYYVLGSALCGLVAALFYPRFFYLAPVAVWLGGISYAAIVYRSKLAPGDPMIFPPCCGVDLCGFLPAMAGAALVFGIAKLARGTQP